MQSRVIIESHVNMESSSSTCSKELFDSPEFLPEETSGNVNSVVSDDNSSPVDAQSPAERDSNGRKKSAGRAVRHAVQTLKSLVKPKAATEPVEPEIAQPSTSTFVSPQNIPCKESEYPSNHSSITGDQLSLTVEDFHRLYKVEEELEYYPGAYEGTRKIDGQKMTFRFIERRQLGEKSASTTVTKPLYEEMAALLILQKDPTCKQIIRLYDCFTMLDVLVMEHPDPYITLEKFLNIKNQHLDEQKAKHIMLELFSVLNHCWNRGVFFPIDVESILINPDTLQIKIMNFSCAQLIVKRSDEAKVEEWLREQAKIKHSENLYRVMEALVRNIRSPFLKRKCLSIGLLQSGRVYRMMDLRPDMTNTSWSVC
ncbi:uncharacterized protein [Pseudorasbora parva]|uniref:uncharacterized protein isoform X2 n=1 Tax=Pseudorasbora parva TaxID=51549 RepID=UPI00351DB022